MNTVTKPWGSYTNLLDEEINITIHKRISEILL
jgi:hypothetical protein